MVVGSGVEMNSLEFLKCACSHAFKRMSNPFDSTTLPVKAKVFLGGKSESNKTGSTINGLGTSDEIFLNFSGTCRT